MPAGRVNVVTPPAREPLTLEEAKVHLSVDGAYRDLAISGLIRSAREQIEVLTRRALIVRTIEAYFDAFCTAIDLPLPPLASVDTVEYRDTAGIWQIADSGLYEVDALRNPGAIALAPDMDWPDTLQARNSVRVTLDAGYGPERSDVPEPLRQAMLFALQELYDHDSLTVEKQRETRDALIASYIVSYV